MVTEHSDYVPFGLSWAVASLLAQSPGVTRDTGVHYQCGRGTEQLCCAYLPWGWGAQVGL